MKKNFKTFAIVLSAAALSISSIMTAAAAQVGTGEWKMGTGENEGRYYFQLSDGSSLANTWYWVKDSDGVIRSYYFDENGWMAANTEVDGYTLDADGHWVQDGQIVTRGEEQDYAAHVSGAAAAEAAGPGTEGAPLVLGETAAPEVLMPENVGVTVVGGTAEGEEVGPGYAGTTPSGKISRNKVKSTGRGDSPSAGVTGAGWAVGNYSGSTVSNDWANYTMNLGGYAITEKGSIESSLDFSIITEGAQLTVSYFPMTQYTAGNTSLDVFVNDYKAFPKNGFTKGSIAENVQLGAYTFRQIRQLAVDPFKTYYDCAYIRQVEGTNFAQVITVEHLGEATDFLNILRTMNRIR